MKVQCVICDRQMTLEDDSPAAKKLRNRPIHTFMCNACSDRIKKKTEARHSTGNFRLYHHHAKVDDF